MILLSFDDVTFLMTLLSCDANISGTHIYIEKNILSKIIIKLVITLLVITKIYAKIS